MLESKFLHALRKRTKSFAADLEQSDLFDHDGDKGEFRERVIENFLRPFLPNCFGIGSGQVFASDGDASKQVDVVLYDNIFSNVLFRDQSNSLFPCESVYGTIEVKSKLDTKKLDESIENIASIKKLNRDSSDMLDFLPFVNIKAGQGISYDRSICNPYLGIIFAYKGLTSETVEKHLNRFLTNENTKKSKSSLPDFIFLHERKTLILKVSANENMNFVPTSLGDDFYLYRSVYLADDILPIFFLTINTCLNQIRLKAPDFNEYWKQVFSLAVQKKFTE